MKKSKTTKPRKETRASGGSHETMLDWTPLYSAFAQAFEWALDVAAKLAADYPEEVEAVERVRVFVRKRLAGQPAHVRVDDVLFTFGLIIGAIERDLGPVVALAPWFSVPSVRLPSAAELWDRDVPRHVPPSWWVGVHTPRCSTNAI